MSRPMTLAELSDLLTFVAENHCPFKHKGGKCIKYVDPHIDMRDGKCFSVQFRGFGSEYVLHSCNEFRDAPETLYERCVSFLADPNWP